MTNGRSLESIAAGEDATAAPSLARATVGLDPPRPWGDHFAKRRTCETFAEKGPFRKHGLDVSGILIVGAVNANTPMLRRGWRVTHRAEDQSPMWRAKAAADQRCPFGAMTNTSTNPRPASSCALSSAWSAVPQAKTMGRPRGSFAFTVYMGKP